MLGLNDILFDKFIDIEFEEYMTQKEAIAFYEADKRSSLLEGFNENMTRSQWAAFVDSKTKKMLIRTPRSGVKPRISVSAEFIPGVRATKVKVGIDNFDCDVDISQLSWARVTMGYLKGGYASFRGTIMNSYAESPNPNGKTVFEFLDAGFLGEVCMAQNTYLKIDESVSWWEAFTAFIKKQGEPIEVVCQKETQTRLERMPMPFVRGTKAFKTLGEAIDFFEGCIKLVSEKYKVEAPRITLQGEKIHVSLGEELPLQIPAFEQVKSVSFTGGGIVVKAPYNPEILPQSLFFINPKFFKGRFNNQSIFNTLVTGFDGDNPLTDMGLGVNSKGVYYCISVAVSFDTYQTNDMLVTGISAGANAENSAAFAKAMAEAELTGNDTYMYDATPERKAAWFAKPSPAPDAEGIELPPLPTVLVTDGGKPESKPEDLPPTVIHVSNATAMKPSSISKLLTSHLADPYVTGAPSITLSTQKTPKKNAMTKRLERIAGWDELIYYLLNSSEGSAMKSGFEARVDALAEKQRGLALKNEIHAVFSGFIPFFMVVNRASYGSTSLTSGFDAYTDSLNCNIKDVPTPVAKVYYPDFAKVIKNDPMAIGLLKDMVGAEGVPRRYKLDFAALQGILESLKEGW